MLSDEIHRLQRKKNTKKYVEYVLVLLCLRRGVLPEAEGILNWSTNFFSKLYLPSTAAKEDQQENHAIVVEEEFAFTLPKARM